MWERKKIEKWFPNCRKKLWWQKFFRQEENNKNIVNNSNNKNIVNNSNNKNIVNSNNSSNIINSNNSSNIINNNNSNNNDDGTKTHKARNKDLQLIQSGPRQTEEKNDFRQ